MKIVGNAALLLLLLLLLKPPSQLNNMSYGPARTNRPRAVYLAVSAPAVTAPTVTSTSRTNESPTRQLLHDIQARTRRVLSTDVVALSSVSLRLATKSESAVGIASVHASSELSKLRTTNQNINEYNNSLCRRNALVADDEHQAHEKDEAVDEPIMR